MNDLLLKGKVHRLNGPKKTGMNLSTARLTRAYLMQEAESGTESDDATDSPNAKARG